MKKASCGAQKLSTLNTPLAVEPQLLLMGNLAAVSLLAVVNLSPPQMAVCLRQSYCDQNSGTSAGIIMGGAALCFPCSNGRAPWLMGWAA